MKKCQPVRKLDLNGNVIATYASAREAARQNCLNHQSMNDYCNGNTKKNIAPDGFIYEWQEEFRRKKAFAS